MKHQGTYGYQGHSGASKLDRPAGQRYETPMVRIAVEVLAHVRSLVGLAQHLHALGCTQGQWEHVVERLQIQQTPHGLTWVSLSTGMRRYTVHADG